MDNAEMMKQMKEKLGSALEIAQAKRREEDRRYIMSTVGQDIAKMIGPFLADVASSAKVNREEMKACMLEVMANVNARQMPGVDTKPITDAIERAMGGMYIPEPKVTVTSPVVNVPDIKMPDHMDIKGWVNLMTNGGAVGHDNPLPVMLMDTKGNPLKLFDNLTQIISGGGGGGGKHDFYTIKGFSQSAYAALTNADGRLRVSVETGGSGLTDNELRAAHLDVQQVSGSIDSVYVTGASGTLAAAIVDSTGVAYSGSNPVPVVITSGAAATTAVQNLNGDGTYRDTFPVQGTVTVAGVTASVQAALVDSTGIQYSGSNPLPITGPVVVSSITATTAANIVDSTGVAYSGSNPVPISGAVTLSGALASSVVTGPVVSDIADDGSAPVKIGGIARQANPTAVAGGDSVSASMDDIGRILTRPVQVRDLIQTAYVQVTTGTEATLYQSASGVFSDLIYIMGANNSDAAVSVDIRAGTANGVVMTLEIPASGTAGVSLQVPLPQDVAANTWTVDLPDITGTTVSVSALFSKEI